jgi:hypothetical protein
MDDEDTPDPSKDLSTRGRNRKNVIASSPHKNEYKKLLTAGWSSLAVERYAMFRYGEDIPAATIRAYRKSMRLQVTKSPLRPAKDVDPEQVIDVVLEQGELIRLQQARIAIDVKHEESMSKLFGGTRMEIRELSTLLKEYKETLQDLGLHPVRGVKLDLTGRMHPGEQPGPPDDGRTRFAPKVRTLGQLFEGGTVSPEQEIQLARMLHDVIPQVEEETLDAGVVDAEIVEDPDGDR